MSILNNLIDNFKSSKPSLDSFLKDLEKSIKNTPSVNYIIDRIEGDYAICENCNTLKLENILLSSLPQNIKPGNVLSLQNGIFNINDILENERKNIIKEKSNKVFKD
jgi:hypothetical protein